MFIQKIKMKCDKISTMCLAGAVANVDYSSLKEEIQRKSWAKIGKIGKT